MPAGKDAWSQIHHELVGLRLKRAREQLSRETNEEMNVILSIIDINPPTTIRPMLVKLGLKQAKKWLSTVYDTYERVWTEQGKRKTAEFVRALFREAIEHQIKAGMTLVSGLIDYANRHVAMSGRLRSLSWGESFFYEQSLRDDWRERTEGEAIRLGAAQTVRSRRRLPTRRRPGKRKEATRRQAQTKSQKRARTVATLFKELSTLEPQIRYETDYWNLANRYPNYLTFPIAKKRDDLRAKVINLQEQTQHMRLAQELAAATHKKKLSTIQTDWKHHKPPEFRRKLS